MSSSVDPSAIFCSCVPTLELGNNSTIDTTEKIEKQIEAPTRVVALMSKRKKRG